MSLMVFAFAQFTMDLEVLFRLLMSAERLHGFTNTVIGATVMLFPTVFLGRPICRVILKVWNSRLSSAQAVWLSVGPDITWRAAWGGGLFGVYSHVILDAVMHADAQPWAPVSTANPFLGFLSVGNIDDLCLWSLGIGAVVLVVQRGRRQGADIGN